jgi:tyrosyl-tRNA synthetase
MNEVRRLGALQGAEIREAKQVLAHEATTICHGREAADAARAGAEAAFKGEGNIADMPFTKMERSDFENGVRATEVFVAVGLAQSKGQAAKLFKGGGGFVGERCLKDHNETITIRDFSDNAVILKAGKKKRHRLVVMD